ncbi:MAG: prepilin-type N-terminal cleavage/methylation domain-containing protein [Elusimicrobiaceae bacterium]|nr:prepilin-type N-terminal cleavage/methylation domain-containing protein [Elusimicrobiaceae bacterium]
MSLGFTKGFTLIELLVVVLIIGILSAVALPQYRVAVAKARVAEQMVLFDAVMKAQQIYYMANGTYTMDLTALDIQVPENSVQCNVPYRTFVQCQSWGSSNGSLAGVSLEYALDNGSGEIIRNCIAFSTLADKVCKSFGGSYKATHSNGNRYYSFDL